MIAEEERSSEQCNAGRGWTKTHVRHGVQE